MRLFTRSRTVKPRKETNPAQWPELSVPLDFSYFNATDRLRNTWKESEVKKRRDMSRERGNR